MYLKLNLIVVGFFLLRRGSIIYFSGEINFYKFLCGSFFFVYYGGGERE